MNDELDKALHDVSKTMQAWDDEEAAGQHSRSTAQLLELQLSFMKLLVGIDRFEELPGYARYLRAAKEWLDGKEMEKLSQELEEMPRKAAKEGINK